MGELNVHKSLLSPSFCGHYIELGGKDSKHSFQRERTANGMQGSPSWDQKRDVASEITKCLQSCELRFFVSSDCQTESGPNDTGKL